MCCPSLPHGTSSGSNGSVPMPRFANEAKLAERVLTILQPYFEIDPEVSADTAQAAYSRSTLYSVTRDPAHGRTTNRPSGSSSSWRIKVLSAPVTSPVGAAGRRTTRTPTGKGTVHCSFHMPITIHASGGDNGWLMAHLLGQFGVGELAPRHEEGWTLSIHDNHILWSERQGVAAAKRWSLRRKLGGGHR